MRRLVHRPKAVFAHVGVALGRCEIDVTKEFLHDAKICSSIEKVCGERMSERVGVRGPARSAVDDPTHVSRTEWAQPPIQKRRSWVRDDGWPRRVHPGREGYRRWFADRNDSLLAALSENCQQLTGTIPRRIAHAAEFRDTQTTAVQQLEDCLILAVPCLVASGTIEQIGHFALREHARKSRPLCRCPDLLGGIEIDRSVCP